MLHRRSTATALVAVLLPLAAALTSCGFDYPTDRVNTIAAGVNNRDGEVEVLGARVLAFADGTGRLIGTLVYSDEKATEPARLTGVEGEAIEPLTGLEVEIQPGEHTNLASDEAEPIGVTGDFSAGEVITLTYTYAVGDATDTATLDVPVVKPCHQYADIAPAPDASAVDAQEGEEAEGEEAHDEESVDTYVCDHATEPVEEEGGH